MMISILNEHFITIVRFIKMSVKYIFSSLTKINFNKN